MYHTRIYYSHLSLYIFAIVMICIALYRKYKHYSKIKSQDFKQTIGTIVDYKIIRGGRGSKGYCSIIRYIVNGKEYRYTQNTSSSFKQPLGKKIEIMYNQNNPADAIEKNDSAWIKFICIGIIIFIYALCFTKLIKSFSNF